MTSIEKEKLRAEHAIDRVLVYLLSKPENDYDASCVNLAEVVGAVNMSRGRVLTSGEVLEALDALVDQELADYHRPGYIPAYWRATNKARREAKTK